ncbi:MAG: hypothetical protein COT43_05970 [Candidatus Marinimicrobia bacterium CG08_land_8_20_14_0_20_45_22]|nr:MAG: hypothetical protein COT43_05970 [Candidatus Marinimicrobia bacterium CG08_land_8_20_14_0_20_45_22]
MKKMLTPALMLAVFLLLGCSPTEPEPEPEPVVWVSEKILTTNGDIKRIAVTDSGAVYYAAAHNREAK